MAVFESAFLWLALNFQTARYMWHTRLQAFWWSVADVLLILAFLKIVDLLKRESGAGGIRYRYWWLWATAALKAAPFFFNTPDAFISLDFFICGLQYGILVYTIVVDYRLLLKLPGWFDLSRHVKKTETPPGDS